MSYDGTYQITSHFWKVFSHPGKVKIRTRGNRLKGKAKVSVIEADLEDGFLDGNHFSFVMRKKILGKPIDMKVTGTFGENGTLKGIMRAPFGTSRLEGHKISKS